MKFLLVQTWTIQIPAAPVCWWMSLSCRRQFLFSDSGLHFSMPVPDLAACPPSIAALPAVIHVFSSTPADLAGRHPRTGHTGEVRSPAVGHLLLRCVLWTRVGRRAVLASWAYPSLLPMDTRTLTAHLYHQTACDTPPLPTAAAHADSPNRPSTDNNTCR